MKKPNLDTLDKLALVALFIFSLFKLKSPLKEESMDNFLFTRSKIGLLFLK